MICGCWRPRPASPNDAIDYLCAVSAWKSAPWRWPQRFDALVFTGGIGENSSPIRAAALAGMEWLSITRDQTANERHERTIAAVHSRLPVFVLKIDEEAMIARHTIETAGVGRPIAAPSE
jgi:hypothetical protein